MAVPSFDYWNEHRKNRRLFSETEIDVAIVSGRTGFMFSRPQFRGTTVNVSASGLALLTKRRLRMGTTLQLWVPAVVNGREKTLKLRGDVVWVRPDDARRQYLYGIHLHGSPKKAMDTWADKMITDIRHFDG